MQVASKVLLTAHTEISQDGRALVVKRFDVDEDAWPLFLELLLDNKILLLTVKS